MHYNETADIWSFACLIYEALTGEYLFNPKKGVNYTKNDDHLALMIETLRKFPKKFSMVGPHRKVSPLIYSISMPIAILIAIK